MKKTYIAEIVKLLENCNDIALIDLIYRLLDKS